MGKKIETIIPYSENRHLGHAIFDMVKNCDDWILILDHDVSLITPIWHDKCQRAIDKLGHDAGWITCLTNRIGCRFQKNSHISDKEENMDMHFAEAKWLHQQFNGEIEEIKETQFKFSGFFVLTHKKCFMEVFRKFGMPGKKFLGWDNWYFDRVRELGYTTHVMKDVYCYHSYRRLWKDDFWIKAKEDSK